MGRNRAFGHVDRILRKTGVGGYPFVRFTPQGAPGKLATPIAARVDDRRLLAMNAYLSQLQAPPGRVGNRAAIARGRQAFRTSGWTGCHNGDQGRPVPATIHAMARIFPGDQPAVLAQRMPPLNPVLDTASSFFDDKMAVVNASMRGEQRGIAMPLLLDLARKPTFLHDDTVKSLDQLFSASRGKRGPHPFYLTDTRQRNDVIAYLRSADTNTR